MKISRVLIAQGQTHFPCAHVNAKFTFYMRTHTAKKTEKPIFLVNRVHWLCMSRFAAFSTHDWCGEWSFGPWITLTGTSERWIEYGLKLNNSIYLCVCVCMYPSLPHENVMMMVIIPTLPRSIVRCLCFSTFNICFPAHVVWENWAFFFSFKNGSRNSCCVGSNASCIFVR